MNFANTTFLLWLIRQLLQFGGAYLTYKGYTDEAGAEQAVDAIYQLVGPASLLIGFAGNIWASFRSKVTVRGQAVAIDQLQPGEKAVVKGAAVEAIARPKTLAERLSGIFSR